MQLLLWKKLWNRGELAGFLQVSWGLVGIRFSLSQFFGREPFSAAAGRYFRCIGGFFGG